VSAWRASTLCRGAALILFAGCGSREPAREVSHVDVVAAPLSAGPLEVVAAAGAILGKASAMKGVVRGRLRIARDGPITIVRINDVYMVEEAELLHIKKGSSRNPVGGFYSFGSWQVRILSLR